MARDIEADALIHDKSSRGLKSVEDNVRKSNDRIKKEYERLGDDSGKALAKKFGQGSSIIGSLLGENITRGLKGAAPAAVAVLAGAAIGAAPVIGGTIAAAVIGGAAGTGILGGVALAVRDPAVKAAGAQLGKNLLTDLQGQARTFVKPLLQSIDLIDRRFDESAGKIGQIFDDASRFVVPLVDSGTRAIQSIISGIANATSKAGPVIDALGAGIQLIGDEIENTFDTLADDGVSAAVALRQAFQLVAGAIRVVSTAVNILTESYGFLAKLGAFGRDAQQQYIVLEANAKLAAEANKELTRSTVEVGDAGRRSQGGTFGLAEATARVGADAATTAEAERLYNKALEDNAKAAAEAASAQRTLFSDTTRVGEALDRAKEAADKNGRTLDANTEKGRANRDALANLANAMNTYRDTQAKAGASTATLSATLRTQRQRFYDVALQITGNKKKANELTAALLGIPAKRTPKIEVKSNAAAEARNARQEIASVKGKTVTVTVNVNASRLASVEKRLARIDQYAYASGLDSFGIAAAGQGRSRVGGPVTVNSVVENRISLDGAPFRDYTTQAIDREHRRAKFRTRVGRRNG